MIDTDSALEEALEAVLKRWQIPAHHLIGGGDRGDLASDLADAARLWFGVLFGSNEK